MTKLLTSCIRWLKLLQCRRSVNKLHDSNMKKLLLVLACGGLFLGTAKASTSTDSPEKPYESWVNDNDTGLFILQQIPLPGNKAFGRDEPGFDDPTYIRLFKVLATNAPVVPVGAFLVIEDVFDVQTRDFYILNLHGDSVKILDHNVFYCFVPEIATCFKIERDKAENYIKRLSTSTSEKR